MFGGTDCKVPESRLKNGWRVSLNFEPEEGRTRGGPITTEGLIVEIAKDGCINNISIIHSQLQLHNK